MSPRKTTEVRRRLLRAGRPRRRALFWVLTGLLTLCVAVAFGVIGLYAGVLSALPGLETLDAVEQMAPIRVFAGEQEGTQSLLAEIARPLRVEPVHISDVSLLLLQAAVVAADEQFLERPAPNLRTLVSGLVAELAGRPPPTLSPILEALARNGSSGQAAQDHGALYEIALAHKVERAWTKERILTAYVNQAYFGEGCYGVGAAAERFFGKDPADLSLAEAAVLAAVASSRGSLSPRTSPEPTLSARNAVLNKMFQHNFIDGTALQEALAAPLGIEAAPAAPVSRCPAWTELVEDQLVKRYGLARTIRGGFDVYTSLDLRLQEAAELALAGALNDAEDPVGGLVALDLKTGTVAALAQTHSGDYPDLFVTPREASGITRPLVLCTALAQGLHPLTVYAGSGQATILAGPDILRLDEAFSQLLRQLGWDAVTGTAERLGLTIAGTDAAAATDETGGDETGGAVSLTPLEAACLFAVFGMQGRAPSASPSQSIVDRLCGRSLLRVESNEEGLLDLASSSWEELIPASAAFLVTQAMTFDSSSSLDVVPSGRSIATISFTSPLSGESWFVGYTSRLLALVWIGYPDTREASDSAAQGRLAPDRTAAVWRQFMNDASAFYEAGRFAPPGDEEWAEVTINEQTGRRVSAGGYFAVTLVLPADLVPSSDSPDAAEQPASTTTAATSTSASTSATSPLTTVQADTTVPELVGLLPGEAEQLAAGAGLRLQVTVGAPGSNPGRICSQNPAPGTRLLRGETIAVVVEASRPATRTTASTTSTTSVEKTAP